MIAATRQALLSRDSYYYRLLSKWTYLHTIKYNNLIASQYKDHEGYIEYHWYEE